MRAVSSADKPSPPKSNVPRDTPERGISRTDVNFVLDAALLVVFTLLMGISAIVRFIFPRASAATGWRLWGYSLDDWCDLQFAVVALLAAMILLHLMLHWTWVCGVVTSRLSRHKQRTIRLDDGNRTLYGVGLLIVIVNVLGLLVGAAALTIRAPDNPPPAKITQGVFPR